ncbi:ESS family glutamate:Na+ symporter [Anoxybacillus voinovskiensis]|uniref:ESS family glutamate:Na+ symporter n=1 Tax=Anoxybacteroides voinovskiense TaxID=230470 RepID=A0A840DRV3_9BACL|nr:sodium/glutamate symporter [Anoxybacillus voinovskiensis]MBB4072259.1 ESS family glutamate:Na+ symporter [Anoxybacillus voinovskiensis]GGJ59307.1 hypothetical protein GCM10008982_05490 [Anoxybacillus voinovskiensis]
MVILFVVLLGIILKISELLERKYELHRYYLSIPFVGSVILLTITVLTKVIFHYRLEPPFLFQRVAVTIFLFSIGFQIALFLNKLFFKRFVILLAICVVLLIFFVHISYFVFPPYNWIVGDLLFAYNEDFIKLTVPSYIQNDMVFWSYVQLAIVFFLTPVFLSIVSKRLDKQDISNIQNCANHLYQEKITIPLTRETAYVVLFALGIVVITQHITVFFLYDYVYAMLGGFSYGLLAKTRQSKLDEKTRMFHQLGTIGLYLFIMTSVQKIAFFDWFRLSYTVFLIVMAKTMIVAVFVVWIVQRLFPTLSFSEKLVTAVAGWSFILSAPVVCMHGMRTVVNKHGAVPYVLLVIPPVILWMVNYIHLTLRLILLQ